MLHLLAVAIAVGCATTLGALPVLASRELSRAAYDSMLGLGAGLMLGASTLGLLTEALVGVRVDGTVHVPLFALVLAGFTGGVALLFGMDRAIPHAHAGGHSEHLHGHEHEAHEHCNHATVDDRARHQGMMIVGAMALHRIPEGFAIGAGFADTRSVPLGVMLAVAAGRKNATEGAVMRRRSSVAASGARGCSRSSRRPACRCRRPRSPGSIWRATWRARCRSCSRSAPAR